MTYDPVGHRYLLATGESARSRLGLLQDIYGASSERLLRQAGLREGMRVLDFACGVGILSCRLASIVGPAGSVVGLDNSPDQLAIARRSAQAQRARNVEFVEADAYDTGLPRGTFDMVYCRFLLCHLQRPDAVLREMAALLAPGGALVCEDLKCSTLSTVPATEIYRRMAAQATELSEARGVDGDIGPTLVPRFLALGLGEIEVNVWQPAFLRGDAKRFWEYSVAEATPTFVQLGLVSAAEMTARLQAMARVNADDSVLLLLPRQWQVIGRKPPAPHH